MDRSKTVELMPIVWRLGTGRTYLDYPRGQDMAAVSELGTAVVPLLTEWLDDDCKVVRTGAAAALGRLAPAVRAPRPRAEGVVELAALI